MLFISALKAAATSPKLIKGAKGVFTILDVTDTVMDAGLLGDEIARAIMGENYDPAVRDLSKQVAEEGKKYDEKMAQVAKANTDINNLTAGINSLHGIFLEYGDKQELVMKQIKKLDDLKQLLNTSAPTTYQWFQTIGAQAINSDVQTKLDAIKARLGPNYLSIALYSGGLGFRAVSVGYSVYKKRKAANQAPPQRAVQPDAFEGVDSDEVRIKRQTAITQNNSLKSRAKTVGKTVYTGVTKLMTVGSFGMNIYTIVMKVQAHEKAIADLKEMLARYNRENPIYSYALNGCMNQDGTINQTALDTVARFFSINLDSEDTKQALAQGYNKILAGYNDNVKTILSGTDGTGGIDGAYTAMIGKFKEVVVEKSEESVITDLQNSYNNFKRLEKIGQDATKPSEDRKNSLDDIREEFTKSVSSKLNNILAKLNVELDDHNSFNQLIVCASKLNEQLQEIPEQYWKKLIKPEAESALNLLNITAKDRSRFKTVEEIQEALTKLMKEAKPLAAA